MKISNITLLILAYLATAALGKGGGGGGRGGGGRGGGGRGGGGRGGGSSGGSRGGGSSAGRGSSTASGRYGNSNGGRPAMTQPGAAVGTRAGSYSYPAGSTSYPKGGYGGFAGSPPPYSYANTRTSYTRYPTTYTGGYGGGTRSGWVGGYNPGLIYWSIIPAWAFIGYYGAYHRFNQDDGAYYAPEISAASSGSYAVLNGTENTSDEDNYYYTFNMTTAYSYPMADHGFVASSDPEANPANFAYRLAFAHIVEFNDANQNGFYDDNEAIVSAVSLDNVAWDNISVSNQTSPANASLWYYEFATVGRNLTHTRTQQPFDAYLTWRSTNLQVNMTEGVPLQPNSLQYNLTLANYPALANSTHRLAIAQILTTQDDTSIFQDVNTTTPIDVANQIKTNQTYGMSLGDYSQGRLEYEPTFNITEVTNPPTQAGIPSDANTNSWIWGDQAATRKQHLLFISIPPSNTNGTPNPRLTGFSFLDTNVMNAMAFENLDSASPKLKLSMMMSLVTVFAAYALFL